MKKIHLILLFVIVLIGCKEARDIKPKVTKNPKSETYQLILKDRGVYVKHIKTPLEKEKPIISLTVPKGQKLYFKNGKREERFEVPYKFDRGIPIFKFPIISKNGDSERLFGLFVAYASTKPKYDFVGYADLGKTDYLFNPKDKPKQELTHSHEWVEAWDTCKGYTALKKDGSLWQFGEVGGCDWGQIYGASMDSVDRSIYTYLLSPKKIADGLKDARIINGGNYIYAIKKDGTLWIFGGDTKSKLVKISDSHDWVSVAIDIGVHDGIGYDIGLKKDGSLWQVTSWLESKPKPLSKDTKWDKVLVDDTCCRVYGQKSDGSIWSSHNGVDFDEVTPKDDFSGSKISSYPKLLVEMKKLNSNSANNYTLYTDKVEVKRDGTLWLLPKVDHELVKKDSVEIYSVEASAQ